MKIAVLDDDPVQVKAIVAIAAQAGLRPVTFSRANALIAAMRKDTFDILILDWNLPDRSGLDVIKWARANLRPAPPMLLITSRSDDADVVTGLNAGADDYLVKPLAPEVLQARLTALLRRAYPEPSVAGAETHGDLAFDASTCSVRREDNVTVLTAKEFNLALILFRNLHRALSRAYLVEAVWGNEPNPNSRSLDMHISRIRTKLGLRPEKGFRLTPVYSYGYRLERVSAVPETAPGDGD